MYKYINLVLLLTFFSLNTLSKTHEHQTNFRRNIFLNVLEDLKEIEEMEDNLDHNKYSFKIDDVSKYNSRKRLIYLLNFRNSRLAKLEINARTDFFSNKKKNVLKIERGEKRSLSSQNTNGHLVGKSSFNRRRESSMSLNALLSIRTRDVLLTTFSEKNIEKSNFSKKPDTNFLTILGMSREIKENGSLEFNLFVQRKKEEEFRLENLALSYSHRVKISNSLYFDPGFSFFYPIYREESFDLSEENYRGVILSPGIKIRAAFLKVGDINYGFNYYHNTYIPEERSFLNVIKYDTGTDNMNFAVGLSNLTFNSGGTDSFKFISSYYCLPVRNLRLIKISFLIQNKLFSFANPDYSFNVSYNF